ncbi:unnamed protein product [Arctia plantaginis]|uniref:Multidrug resistance-associated protein lethal(2)03659 n=1 Tax=Arctia plantaginis TaxID=874455 RepID=A0A8S1A9A3_ARCPL|nr:unnamed protein product [Arctia plantaginis]
MDTGPKLRRRANPRYTANLFSILTFGWTLETFKLGYSRDITDGDLYAPLPEHRSDILGDAVQKAWDEEMKIAQRSRERGGNYKPSLWQVLFKVFGPELMLYGLILAAMEFLIRANSTYINRLFSYYDMAGDVSWGEAIFFAFGIIFCSSVNVMVQHPFMMAVMHMGMKMRVGMCSLIYRKSLKVNIQALSESSAGLVVNLMANDVNRFDTGPLFAHYLWIGPLETVLLTVYVYREMGMPAVYGSLIIIAVIPFQIFLGLNTAYFRRKTAEKTDERVRLMKEIIMGMEVIKMYTWEKPFRKLIDLVRRQEIFFIKMTSYIRGIIMSFIMFTSRFGIFITVLLYVKYVNRITVENVFFLTCFYNITKQTMTLYFPQAVGQIAEMNVAVQRIRDYLLSEECDLPLREQPQSDEVRSSKKKRVTILEPLSYRPLSSLSSQPSTSQNVPADDPQEIHAEEIIIKFEDASTKWLRSSDKDDVANLNLTIYGGCLTTVIGSVGSGKSTLLHMVLSELPCSNGRLQVNGSVSYACQDPWLFVGSVRQNILFGQSFQKARYMEVCRVCALERDISLFPHGDKTVVGERGVSLSGGQRARINLARAVYKEADIYLLDDPLSAVDTEVAKHIFDRCIKKYLVKKTVVLVTHQLQFIKMVDQVVIMDKGKIVDVGAFDELDDQKLEAEFQTVGRVGGSVYRDYFLANAPCLQAVFVFFMFLLAQFCASACDYWISRCPVFGHVNASILGLATIRSFGAEFLLAQEFDRHQDLHSAAWYLFITCSRAFGYFLDLICLLFIICVTFSCLMKTDMDASSVGLAITQSISLTGIFQWGMRQSAEMENQMTSVERILEYTKLPHEPALYSDPNKKPPSDWPKEGAIEFKDLTLRYTPDGNYVLHKLQFSIQPREKIGIVGRTGAGKSSIIQALFRLAYLEGAITIDGVDITSIGLHDLRQKLSIIPQEPVLFSGTIRKNLDPFDQYSDDVLLNALYNVELQTDEVGVAALYKEVQEGGSNFSVGERQLVCLARAIVHNDKILVLDEATANVDAQTDALIQTAIRQHFNSCTVLTVAHRLNTIIDSDKILVLDAGRLMEFDHPHILLQNKKGYFRKMVAETGPTMSNLLQKQAAEVKNKEIMNTRI